MKESIQTLDQTKPFQHVFFLKGINLLYSAPAISLIYAKFNCIKNIFETANNNPHNKGKSIEL